MILFGSHVKGTASKRSDLDVLFVVQNKDAEKEISSAVGSVARITPIGIHDVILTSEEFAQLLRERKPNVAWEAVDDRIVPYGAEPLFKFLEDVM
jgi:predicted nucleotidyltransferase